MDKYDECSSSPQSSTRKKISKELERFSHETTCHGLVNLYSADSTWKRIAWLVIIGVAAALCAIASILMCWSYFQYPTTTSVGIKPVVQLTFPKITICNINMFKRSKLKGTRFESFLDIEDNVGEGFDHAGESWTDRSDVEFLNEEDTFNYWVNKEWVNDQNGTERKPWSYIIDVDNEGMVGMWSSLIFPTEAEMSELGHQAEDFILKCKFDVYPCSHRQFKRVFLPAYGNCFVFNDNREEPIVTSKSGGEYGLKLTLSLEVDEHLGFLTPSPSVTVVINNQDGYVIPFLDGFSVSAGMSTKVSMTQTNMKRLSAPYGKCSSIQQNYTRNACISELKRRSLLEKCQCTPDGHGIDGYRPCDAQTTADALCVQTLYLKFDENSTEVNCLQACEETTYETSISSVNWPSRKHMPFLNRSLLTNKAYAAQHLTDYEKARENLLELQIFFGDMSYISISEEPLYMKFYLLGSIGGVLGLFIGVSIITVFEFIELFVRLLFIVTKPTKGN